jgi:hypothetical protein
MSQSDMNTDTYNKVKAFADELFDVSLIKTKIVLLYDKYMCSYEYGVYRVVCFAFDTF